MKRQGICRKKSCFFSPSLTKIEIYFKQENEIINSSELKSTEWQLVCFYNSEVIKTQYIMTKIQIEMQIIKKTQNNGKD